MSDSNKIFFGGSGKLGTEFASQYPEYLFPTHSEVDITNYPLVYEYLGDTQAEIAVNSVALVGLNECERNKREAYFVNVLGTQNIARACGEFNARMIYVSSVSIFDGEQGNYTEEAIPNPQYYYALTKLLGEQSVAMLKDFLIIRTDFFVPGTFKYKTVFTDHYCSKISVQKLAYYLDLLARSNVTGIMNVGVERETLFNILFPYIEGIVGVEIANSTMPNFPRDLSLDLHKFKDFLVSRGDNI